MKRISDSSWAGLAVMGIVLVWLLAPPPSHAQLPASGPVVAELLPIQQAMTNFMATNQFAAGTIALMKDSKLVFRNGYGWRDTNRTLVTHPDNLFRLASVSKMLTASAIAKLVADGRLTTSTKVYSYLNIPPAGGTLGDSRITNITVQNLLDHKGGWDNSISPVGDPVFRTIQVSTELGLNYPAEATNVISWMFAKPLDFAPGSASVYANFGYQILGRVVEKASGKPFKTYIAEDLLGSFGISNVVQARSRPADRHPWEIWYDDGAVDDSGLGVEMSAVDFPANKLARVNDGGMYYESFDAFGGMSASAGDLCRYLRSYFEGSGRRPQGGNYSWGYLFYGSLPGTTTVLYQNISQTSTTTNGLEMAILFNRRIGSDPNGAAYNAVYSSTTNISSWPTAAGGKIEWAVRSTNVSESASGVTMTLVRSGGSSGLVTVSYSTYGITAGADDYSPHSGLISFSPGVTNRTITIPIYNNSIRESDKEFNLELLSVSGGAWLGDRVTCTVRIADDDASGLTPPSVIAQPPNLAVRTSSNATFSVSAAGAAPLTFQWSLNGTDLPGATNASYNRTNAQTAAMGNYTVIISNAAGAVTSAPANLLVVGSGTYSAGTLRNETYLGVAGRSIYDLGFSARFPDLPDATSTLSSFELPLNSANTFGARVSGLFTAPATADYTFYIASDDQGALWISTNEQPANKIMIAFEPDYNGSRQYITGSNQGSRGNPPSNISSPIPLVTGQRCYIEALFKEGSGGDNLAVAFKMSSGGSIGNGSAPIPAANLGMLTIPAIITSQPQDQMVRAGEAIRFEATAMGTTPLRYQWRRNSTNVPGATNRVFSIAGVQSAHAGGYDLVLTGPANTTTSRLAQLTISNSPAITLPPQLGAGGALAFDGAGDSVAVSQSANLNAYPITITAWVKTYDSSGGLVNKYVQGILNGYNISIVNGEVRAWYIRDAANYVWDGANGLNGGPINNGAWHHIAFTVDSAGGKLYVDGAVRATQVWTGQAGAVTTTRALWFGRFEADYLAGFLDEISLWNVALSQSQIQGLMARTLTGGEPGLVGYWQFNERSGTRASDVTGNGNHGVLANPTWVSSDLSIDLPVCITGPASAGLRSMVLSGTLIPGGDSSTAWFAWGSTPSFGNASPAKSVGASTVPTNLTAAISNLIAGSRYHYRLVASNSSGVYAGGTSNLVLPPQILTADRQSNGSIRLTFEGSTNLSFAVVGSPDITAGQTNWTPVGFPLPIGSNRFEFIDGPANTAPARFYKVKGP